MDSTISNPDPKKSTIFFIITTIIYGVFVVSNILASTTTEEVENINSNSIYILVYILLLIIGMFAINLNIAKMICPADKVSIQSIFFSTLLPWLFIFGILYIVLEIFTGWVKPFSNTIGYFIVNLLDLESTIKKILIKPDENTDNNKSVAIAISKINKNYSKFINEFDIESNLYKIFIQKLSNEKIIKIPNDDSKEKEEIIHLFKLINIKHLIGKLVWYILAGSIVTSVSYNYIINMRCNQSIEELQRAISISS